MAYIHSHSCDDCGVSVECAGPMAQLNYHENRFACVDYDVFQTNFDGWRCASCQKQYDEREGPEPDVNGWSLSERLESDARIGRGR